MVYSDGKRSTDCIVAKPPCFSHSFSFKNENKSVPTIMITNPATAVLINPILLKNNDTRIYDAIKMCKWARKNHLSISILILWVIPDNNSHEVLLNASKILTLPASKNTPPTISVCKMGSTINA